jgi:hypothetical protein
MKEITRAATIARMVSTTWTICTANGQSTEPPTPLKIKIKKVADGHKNKTDHHVIHHAHTRYRHRWRRETCHSAFIRGRRLFYLIPLVTYRAEDFLRWSCSHRQNTLLARISRERHRAATLRLANATSYRFLHTFVSFAPPGKTVPLLAVRSGPSSALPAAGMRVCAGRAALHKAGARQPADREATPLPSLPLLAPGYERTVASLGVPEPPAADHGSP